MHVGITWPQWFKENVLNLLFSISLPCWWGWEWVKWVNRCHAAGSILVNRKIYLYFLSFLSSQIVLVLEILPHGIQGRTWLFHTVKHHMANKQARSLGIGSYGSDKVLLEYSCFSIRRVNTLRPRQNSRHFADNVFKCIFLNGNLWISIKISLKFVPECPINNIPALVHIMAWRRTGDKPLSEPMMA